ncbi:MAG: ElyC/SanA/YdcF family protein [Pyrinomonadaceae bacterium]
MKLFLRIVLISAGVILIGLLTLGLINKYVQSTVAGKLETSMTEIPAEDPPRIAIVFGARVWEGGRLSDALYDRVITAVELYRAGRVKKILMSGDNPTQDYDEPTAMKDEAVKLGVPEEDIILDFAGRRTYDTCYRAKEIFEVEKAILVTQEFHQPRALYLCNSLGVDSIGISANRRKYLHENSWAVRELMATASAWFEMNFFPFEPIKGEKEPIGREISREEAVSIAKRHLSSDYDPELYDPLAFDRKTYWGVEFVLKKEHKHLTGGGAVVEVDKKDGKVINQYFAK